jgi:hypothetical protein
MKSGHLFWGIFLIVLGGLILTNNYLNLSIEFDWLLKFWPLILILIGLKILSKNKILDSSLLILSAILLALIVYSFLFENVTCRTIRHFRDWDTKEKKETISQQYIPSIKKSELEVDFSLGDFSLQTDRSKLIEGEVIYSVGNYRFDGEIFDTTAKFKLTSSESKQIKVIGDKKVNKLSLQLSSQPQWDLYLKTNFVENDLNIKNLKLDYLNLESNFSKGEIRIIPLTDKSKATIDLNFSKLKIYIPDSIGVEIYIDKNLSSLNLSGFKEIEDDHYQSENFNNSNQKIQINLNSNFSKVEILH